MADQFVLSFKGDAENVLVTEAEELVHMVAYPDVLTDMTVSSGGIKLRRGGRGFGPSASCPVNASCLNKPYGESKTLKPLVH